MLNLWQRRRVFLHASATRDNIIAVSGVPKKDLREKKVSGELERIMEKKAMFLANPGDKTIQVIDGNDAYTAGVVAPILFEGDSIGSVIFLTDAQAKLAKSKPSWLRPPQAFLARRWNNPDYQNAFVYQRP